MNLSDLMFPYERFYLQTIGNSMCLLRDNEVNGLPSIRLEYSDTTNILCDFLNKLYQSSQEFEKFKVKQFSEVTDLFEEYSEDFLCNSFSYSKSDDSIGVVVKNEKVVEQFTIPNEYDECINFLVDYINKQQTIIDGLYYDLNGVKQSFDVYRKQSTQRIKELIELYQKGVEGNE